MKKTTNSIGSSLQDVEVTACNLTNFNRIQEATINLVSSPFRPTRLTIELENQTLELETKGVGTIRNQNVISGVAKLFHDVEEFSPEVANIAVKFEDGNYWLKFADSENNSLCEMKFKAEGHIPRQDLTFS